MANTIMSLSPGASIAIARCGTLLRAVTALFILALVSAINGITGLAPRSEASAHEKVTSSCSSLGNWLLNPLPQSAACIIFLPGG